jgi:hypothetical protein
VGTLAGDGNVFPPFFFLHFISVRILCYCLMFQNAHGKFGACSSNVELIAAK